MPKGQPCLGREPVPNVRHFEQSVKQTRLLCTEFDELIHLHHPLSRIRSHVLPIIPAFYLRKLLKFVFPAHCWASHASSPNRFPVQHSKHPAFTWKAHDAANKFPLLRSAGFSSRFHVACFNHFSHTLTSNMQNFVPWIMPTNPAWSSNHASDHASEVDIKFFHIGSSDAPATSSKTSNWRHDGIENFQFVSDGHISAAKAGCCKAGLPTPHSKKWR